MAPVLRESTASGKTEGHGGCHGGLVQSIRNVGSKQGPTRQVLSTAGRVLFGRSKLAASNRRKAQPVSQSLSDNSSKQDPREKPVSAAKESPTVIVATQSRKRRRSSILEPQTCQRKFRMGQKHDINIHEDESDGVDHELLDQMDAHIVMHEVEDNMQQSDWDTYGSADDEEEDEVDPTVVEDMEKLERDFTGISSRYRLINRIGEGTFSTVYKAKQLDQGSDDENSNPDSQLMKPRRKEWAYHNTRFVALKKIYVTSSPQRILNELELLHALRHSPYICPLFTAHRHLDQVILTLPYFRHLDFRLYYRDFITNDLRHYFRSLFSGLAAVHRAGIIHRDIKPTNFLYDHDRKIGVLVDFGLAEREGTDWQNCVCTLDKEDRRARFLNSFAVTSLQQTPRLLSSGYPKASNDTRPSRRANRAGTRGFRAPEVLLKCTSQTTRIDIWSAGVILLTLMGRRFPFFNSADDIDAVIEIASIFGKKKMQGVAALHGSVFETNIETIGDRGFGLEKIVLWAACREGQPGEELHAGEKQAIDLLKGLLELDPHRRLSARQALEHEFFREPVEDEYERQEREEQEGIEEEARLKKQAKKAKKRTKVDQDQMLLV